MPTHGVLLLCVSNYDSPIITNQDMYLLGYHNSNVNCKLIKIPTSSDANIEIFNAVFKEGKLTITFAKDCVMVRVFARAQ